MRCKYSTFSYTTVSSNVIGCMVGCMNKDELPVSFIELYKELVESLFDNLRGNFHLDTSKLFEKPFTIEADKTANINDKPFSHKIKLTWDYSTISVRLYYKFSEIWHELIWVGHLMVCYGWEDWNQWEKFKKRVLGEINLLIAKRFIRNIAKCISYPAVICGGLFLFMEAFKYIGLI